MKKFLTQKWVLITLVFLAFLTIMFFKRKGDLSKIDEKYNFIMLASTTEAAAIKAEAEAAAAANSVTLEEQIYQEAIEQLRKKDKKFIVFTA